MLACPHERLQNHTFIDEGVFVKINSCGLNLRILRVAASSNNIGKFFDAVISVNELGIFKPDPRVYQLCSDRLGVAPGEIAFVSSNGWDAAGAKAFGFTTFWINRASAPVERLGFTPDQVLKSLAELPPQLS